MLNLYRELEALQCPQCGSVALAPVDKLLLSPRSTRACRGCGARYSTSVLTWTLVIVSVLALLANRFVMDPTGQTFGIACALVLLAYALIQVFLVPLVRRQ